MYARVITFQYQPGKIDQALAILRETVLPELRQLPGFQGASNLVDYGNNKVLGITYWQTEADLKASGASITHPRIQERLAKVSIFFAAAPVADNYEVSDQE
jgi:heme-degrading monooxygenase HmoA